MKPFTFEELQKILELKAEEIETDSLIFEATISYIEKLIGYTLEDKNYNELHTVKDCMVFTDHKNISEMINIIDMTTKLRVPNCVIDGQRILFIDPKLEGHVVFLNKKDFIKQTNLDDETEFELPHNIQSVINLYRRKCL